jgi:hypothetical protein
MGIGAGGSTRPADSKPAFGGRRKSEVQNLLKQALSPAQKYIGEIRWQPAQNDFGDFAAQIAGIAMRCSAGNL